MPKSVATVPPVGVPVVMNPFTVVAAVTTVLAVQAVLVRLVAISPLAAMGQYNIIPEAPGLLIMGVAKLIMGPGVRATDPTV